MKPVASRLAEHEEIVVLGRAIAEKGRETGQTGPLCPTAGIVRSAQSRLGRDSLLRIERQNTTDARVYGPRMPPSFGIKRPPRAPSLSSR